MPKRSIAIFDLGGVLIDWDPRYLYRKLFDGNEAAMEDFLANVCNPAWNEQQDAGRSVAVAKTVLKADYPGKAELIDAWFERFDEMMAGAVDGTVEIVAELHERQVPLYALSNWSSETFPVALRRFGFLSWFRGILLSGEVKLMKPDPRIFTALLDRFSINPQQAVYIDDHLRNVEAATAMGLHGIHFPEPAALRGALADVGLL
jgi:2-haloacid dehalogenase